jgi:hypothetical protein
MVALAEKGLIKRDAGKKRITFSSFLFLVPPIYGRVYYSTLIFYSVRRERERHSLCRSKTQRTLICYLRDARKKSTRLIQREEKKEKSVLTSFVYILFLSFFMTDTAFNFLDPWSIMTITRMKSSTMH